MSETANWFARQLGRAQQQQQQQQQYPPSQHPATVPVPQQQPYGPQPGVPPVVGVDSTGRPITTVMDGVAAWQGTRAAQADSGVCPDCGSTNYFKRETMRMKRTANGASPSPICMDCGGNSIFEQQYGTATPLDPKAPVWGET